MMTLKALMPAKDELLLASAVSVSLGTFGYFAIPWDTIGLGAHSPSAQAAALYAQIEEANQKYFDTYGMWPNEATDGSPAANAAVLMSRTALAAPYANDVRYQPVMKGLLESHEDGLTARHSYGQGGTITETPLNGSSYRFVIAFDNLTLEQAKALDEQVDGDFSPAKGRLRIVEEDGHVVAKYLANSRSSKVAAR
jgi:hypothetical protein